MRMDDGWSLAPSGRRYAVSSPLWSGPLLFSLGQLTSFKSAAARVHKERGVELPEDLRAGWLDRVLRLLCQAGQEAAA